MNQSGEAATIDLREPESVSRRSRRWGARVNIGRRERLLTSAAGAALLGAGLMKRGRAGTAMTVGASALLARAVSGYCPVYAARGIDRAAAARRPRTVRKAVTVQREPAELYAFWRKLENLPQVMENVESIRQVGNGRSVWRVKGPAGRRLEWTAEITEDVPDERISWRTADADVAHTGTVEFRRAPEGRGSEVHVTLAYEPPAGAAGAAVAALLGRSPALQVAKDLRRFKQVIETGEVASTEGQPRGGRHSRHTERGTTA